MSSLLPPSAPASNRAHSRPTGRRPGQRGDGVVPHLVRALRIAITAHLTSNVGGHIPHCAAATPRRVAVQRATPSARSERPSRAAGTTFAPGPATLESDLPRRSALFMRSKHKVLRPNAS